MQPWRQCNGLALQLMQSLGLWQPLALTNDDKRHCNQFGSRLKSIVKFSFSNPRTTFLYCCYQLFLNLVLGALKKRLTDTNTRVINSKKANTAKPTDHPGGAISARPNGCYCGRSKKLKRLGVAVNPFPHSNWWTCSGVLKEAARQFCQLER